jgi:hypothetical protein
MAELISLATFADARGKLTVIDRVLPFPMVRLFYIYGVDESERGGHRHVKTRQAAICLQGSCKIYNNNGQTEQVFTLDTPTKCLILEPEDWHTMSEFSPDAILMVIASEPFNKEDYIYEPYPDTLRKP